MYNNLTYDEWYNFYNPIKNEISKYQADFLTAFETYGEELEFVRSQPDNLIWTEIDGDEGVYIVNGYHFVNRIQYYITEKPWVEDVVVTVNIYKECDCNVEGEASQDCQECDGNGYITIYPDTREQLEEIYGANK